MAWGHRGNKGLSVNGPTAATTACHLPDAVLHLQAHPPRADAVPYQRASSCLPHRGGGRLLLRELVLQEDRKLLDEGGQPIGLLPHQLRQIGLHLGRKAAQHSAARGSRRSRGYKQ